MNKSGHPASVLRQKQIEIARENVVKAEKDGKLTKAQTGLINEQSWFKIFVPAAYGGSQLPLPEILELLESLAWADGSVGWTVSKCALAGWSGGFMGSDLTAEVLSGDKACIAGNGDVSGTAGKTKNGYTINGKWANVAGAAEATAFVVNCAVTQSDGPVAEEHGTPHVLSFLLQRNEVEVGSAWNGMGLAATSSQDIEVKNLKIPADRSFKANAENAVASSRIYHLPYLQLAEAVLAANISGMAFRFVELCQLLLAGMQDERGAALINDNLVQDALDKYVQKMLDARMKLYYAVELTWQACANQQTIKDTILYKVSAAAQDVTRKARECVDALYPFCGIAAMDKTAEINRVWRDLHTASHERLLVFGGL